METQGRGHDGQFERTPDTAERDAEACRLRTRGYTYQQIAEHMGYTNRSAAYKAVRRAMRDIVAEPAEDLRRLELDRLDMMWQKALDVLEREHVAYSVGKVVRRAIPVLDNTGQPVMDPETGDPMLHWVDVLDDGPALAALDRLLKIQERRAKLLGLDAPSKSRVEVVTQDQIEAEIARLSHEIAEQERQLEQERVNGGTGQD